MSVLFTTYNHARFAEQALDSLAAQTFQDFEIVATDDCSSDESASIVRAWLDAHDVDASLVVNERNVGICSVRNRALARARGQLVCSLSGDDFFAPDRLERQAPFLLAQPADVAAVYSDAATCNEDGGVIGSYCDPHLPSGVRPQGWVFRDLQRTCFIPAPAVLVRRSAIEAVGGYDESLVFEDWDMWLRLADRFRFSYLPMTASTKRELKTSLSTSRGRSPEYQMSVVRIATRWKGRDKESDRWVAHWVRRAALLVSRSDRRGAREALASVRDIPPDDGVPWTVIRWALAVPGSGVVLNATMDVRRRLRSPGV